MARPVGACAPLWIVALLAACTPAASGDADGSVGADAPAVDSPVVDAPAADAPMVDAPAVDAPAVDVPAVDARAVDAPALDAPALDAPAVDAPVVDAPVVDAPVVDASRADASAGADVATSPDATRDAGGIEAGALDAGALDGSVADAGFADASTDRGLPPIDAFGGALPTPSRAPATWGPHRVTTRTDVGDGLTPTQRLVYGYTARRVNYFDTERWNGSAWDPYERSTYAYTTTGAIDARIVYRFTGRWTEFERWRYEYNADGTLRAQHGDVRNGTAWGELSQITWEWAGGLPAWQRYFTAPRVGVPSVRFWENTYEYDLTGRFTSVWRIERTRATDPFRLAGRRTPIARATGHVDRETFTLAGVTTERVYRYDATGALLEVADPAAVDRYAYDPMGHLEFVRSYTAVDGAWRLTTEVQIEGTAEGGDLTWTLDPEAHETWRRDLYGRGNLVDRYRR